MKKDPRLRWEGPFGTLRPILDRADVAFTNFELAVISDEDRCGLPPDYEVSLGTPSIPRESRPGNTGGPHAVAPSVMEFLAYQGLNPEIGGYDEPRPWEGLLSDSILNRFRDLSAEYGTAISFSERRAIVDIGPEG